jgi:hypothetical protein
LPIGLREGNPAGGDPLREDPGLRTGAAFREEEQVFVGHFQETGTDLQPQLIAEMCRHRPAELGLARFGQRIDDVGGQLSLESEGDRIAFPSVQQF